jgi:hypothetical protein
MSPGRWRVGRALPARRGEGIGIEITESVLRGVRIAPDEPGPVAAAEVPIRSARDDAAGVDALVRLHAELRSPDAPTRLAAFPAASALQRIDVTGCDGSTLNALRHDLDHDLGITSSVLVDDGPRRWLVAVSWDGRRIRRLEELAERAGFADVSVDPSPIALARVLPRGTTLARRTASGTEAFEVALADGQPVVAISVDTVGRPHPAVTTADAPFSVGLFDEIVDPDTLATLVQRITSAAIPDTRSGPLALVVADEDHPDYPAHDVRSGDRLAVALGAAVGAAGLAGRLRPVDMLLPPTPVIDESERPWAIERISPQLEHTEPGKIGPVRRTIARALPRRRRDRRPHR